LENPETYLNLNPVNLLIVSGIIQGFIISGILFFRKTDQPVSSKLLSGTILFVSLHLANLMIVDLNLEVRFPYLLWIPSSYLTAIGPLVFLYTKSLTNVSFGITKKDSLQFIPVIVELIFHAIQVTYCLKNNVQYYRTPFYFIFSLLIYIWTGISIVYYLKMSLEKIDKYELLVLKNFTNLKQVTLAWLRKLIVYYRWLWMCWVPFIIVLLVSFQFQKQHIIIVIILYTLVIVITYLTYWIGLEGLRRIDFTFAKYQLSTYDQKSYINVPKHEIDNYIARVEQLMLKEKIFRDENLSLRNLAQQADIEPNLLSHILNTNLQKNFYEYINTFRVEEVMRRMKDPKYAHFKLLAIAYDCGFNSKATFNRAFKKETGVPPSAFKKSK